jgi:hypothetical protein
MSKEMVENLTYEMWKLCTGKDVAAVVGAGLNIVFTALDSVDSPEIRTHFAHSLRDMARQIENDATESVH